jgi:hypothetical protein
MKPLLGVFRANDHRLEIFLHHLNRAEKAVVRHLCGSQDLFETRQTVVAFLCSMTKAAGESRQNRSQWGKRYRGYVGLSFAPEFGNEADQQSGNNNDHPVLHDFNPFLFGL